MGNLEQQKNKYWIYLENKQILNFHINWLSLNTHIWYSSAHQQRKYENLIKYLDISFKKSILWIHPENMAVIQHKTHVYSMECP